VEGFRFTLEQPVVWRDLDALGHVNNAVYASYIENARLEYITQLDQGEHFSFRNLILADLQITFKSPAFLQEWLVIGIRVSEIRTSSFVVESRLVEKETGRLVATSRAVLVHYDYDVNRSQPVSPELRAVLSRFEGREL
jgi:acyl-CoA thioester hydrolase